MDDYFQDGVTDDCVSCNSEETAKSSTSAGPLVLPISIGILLFVVGIAVAAVNRPGNLRYLYLQYVERLTVNVDLNLVFFCCVIETTHFSCTSQVSSHHITIFIVSMQLAVNYHATFVFKNAGNLPEPFATVIRWADILSLDALAVFRMDCAVAGTNYYTKLFAATLLPLVVVIGVTVDRMGRVLYGGAFNPMKWMMMLVMHLVS